VPDIGQRTHVNLFLCNISRIEKEVGRHMSTSWKSTKLWQLLEKDPAAEATRHYVQSWLDDVETLLGKAGTAPLDFTLHDDDHSFRVAERMAEVIPQDTLEKLSDFEVALLLQSAYLHDIGMNPRRKIVREIRDYLFTGITGDLDGTEAPNLQKWLDEAYPGTQPPVAQGLPDKDRLYQAEFLSAYFCRHRHNDWSERYILETAETIRNPPYAMWTQDLVALCKSHHFGLPGLMDDQFNLRIAGSGNKLVNLRYLAAVLRVADILDFDPKRTPEVIFSYRSIDPRSRIFWHKDHGIVLALDQRNWQILVSARTSNAWIHKAVLDTADAVDLELQTCAAINDQGGFTRGVRLDKADHYKWLWPRLSAKDISPRPSSFVYIDGAFRPDARRVIALLAGTQIYHTPLVAVREVLQNAFDAVKEQIALELLQDPNPADPDVQSARSKVHRVSLSLEEAMNETWIVCSDTGVGMTRRVIERYLLVSGSKPRPEVLALQRQCTTRGIKLDRSGEFGIGVLSYFMLADKVIIETRSSPEAYHENETHGWRFETEGIDAFGELRSLDRTQRGSTIRLRIKEKFKSDLGKNLEEYIAYLVTKVPCQFETKLETNKNISAGWVKEQDHLVPKALPNWRNYGSSDRVKLKSTRQKEEAEKHQREITTATEGALSALRLYGPRVGDFPDGLGTYRMSLPYFQLSGGSSLVYLHQDADVIRPLPDGKLLVSASAGLAASWRGFATFGGHGYRLMFDNVSTIFGGPAPLMVEQDIVAGAKISVDRESLEFEHERRTRSFLEDEGKELLTQFISQNSDSSFAALSPFWINLLGERARDVDSFWLFPNEGSSSEEYRWRKAQFPALFIPRVTGEYEHRLSRDRLTASGYKDEVRPIELGYDHVLPLCNHAPSRLVLVDRFWLQPGLVFEGGKDDLRYDSRLMASFPSEWPNVLAATTGDLVIFNTNHQVCQRVTKEVWAAFQTFSENKLSGEILQHIISPDFAAAWLLSICGLDAEQWNAFRDNYIEGFKNIFQLTSDSGVGTDFLIWKTQHTSGIRRLSSSGGTFKEGYLSRRSDSLLPLPDDKKWFV
jgi:hypothetical protein